MRDIIAKAKAALAQVKEKMRSMRRNVSEETEEFVHEAETEEIFVAVSIKETATRFWQSIRKQARMLIGKLSSRERLAVIFVIGLIIGFGIKTVASEYITMGYRDYTAKNTNVYNLIDLQKKVTASGSDAAFSGGGSAGGATCSQ